MCGRYALSLAPSQVRQRFADHRLPVDDAPDDEDSHIRQTYNFAPGYHGLIYRGSSAADHGVEDASEANEEPSSKKAKHSHTAASSEFTGPTTFKLQAAKWGLIPFWTKRQPDYASQLKTINCRDDSLMEDRGMWTPMKKRKRCIVIAEGFYEWLKKPHNPKEKIPHFIKRKDGQLMLMAGLWDSVQYEGSDDPPLYTYTIITTDSNPQLSFLHDRMPVILEPNSKEMQAWLDPKNVGWTKDLQRTLRPYEGELECYPVDKAVGKVGNNSPLFTVPVDSKENKKNIANFFGKQRETANEVAMKNQAVKEEQKAEKEDKRETTERVESKEDNAPLPKPKSESEEKFSERMDDDGDVIKKEDGDDERGTKRKLSQIGDEASHTIDGGRTGKDAHHDKSTSSPMKAQRQPSRTNSPIKKTRSATTNNTIAKTPQKSDNAKITSFFGK